MPQIDMEPGDYREIKPRWWRWRLPWGHRDGARLPFVMMLFGVSMIAYAYSRAGEVSDSGLMLLFGSLVGFSAGILFMRAFSE